ncbi:TetR/AcrR family transcriptional regulator, partial [Streptomyces nigra]
MSPEQRREMIIQTAIPLIAEYGGTVTTAKIARAAGIGEGTIFRVFADKDELIQACVAEALSPDHAIRELDAIDLAQPLPDRLAEAAEALQAHMARMGAVMGSLGTAVEDAHPDLGGVGLGALKPGRHRGRLLLL